MRAIYTKYGIDFSLEENQIITLVVENPRVIYLSKLMEKREGGFCQSKTRFFHLIKLAC